MHIKRPVSDMSAPLVSQIERGEFQAQESVLKQLEVLQEEEKEFQHIKVGTETGRKEAVI